MLCLPHWRRASRDLTGPALALHTAAASGDLPAVERNMGYYNAFFSVDRANRSALAVAAAHGHTEVVKVLLTAGMDPNARDRHGDFPLLTAARGGHTGVVRTLLSSPVLDLGAKHADSYTTPLMAAAAGPAEREAAAIAGLLLNRRAPAYLVDKHGRTAAAIAAAAGHAGLAHTLRHHVAHVDPGIDTEHYLRALQKKLNVATPAAALAVFTRVRFYFLLSWIDDGGAVVGA